MVLKHLVLKHHHDKAEYGSPKPPMLLEAELLHHIDTIDARVYDFEKALADVKPGDFSEPVWSLDRRALYRPAFGGIDPIGGSNRGVTRIGENPRFRCGRHLIRKNDGGRNMVKNYILDTNVIVHDPTCFYRFEDNNVIVPIVTIEELDNIKNREGMVGYHARMAARELNSLREQGSLEEGVKLPGGGMLRVEHNHMDMDGFPQGTNLQHNDMRIIAVARNLQLEDLSTKTILVTKDVYMLLKADTFGVSARGLHQ